MLFFCDVQIGRNAPEAIVLSINLHDRSSDKIALLSQIQDSKQISAINYGPYDNGHLIVGLNTGVLLAYDVQNSFQLVF